MSKNCLWCKVPIEEPFTRKGGEQVQACDKDCAHGLKVCEKIEKNLKMIPEPLLVDFEADLFAGL